MFSRKKPPSKPKAQSGASRGRSLSQYGFFDIPNLVNDGEIVNMDDDEDQDLEAELLAITGASSAPQRRKKVPVNVPAPDLDVMVAASLKDIPSDESVSGDEDDPDLLEELSAITGKEDEDLEPATPISSVTVPGAQEELLLLRLAMYQEAEANAKAAGETARVRRCSRGIKTLCDLLKQASKGIVISEEEIPPEVSVKKADPKPASLAMETQPEHEEPAAPTRKAPLPPVPPRGAGLGVALPGLTGQPPLSPQLTLDESSAASSPQVTFLPSSPRSLASADAQAPVVNEQLPISSPETLLPSSPPSVATSDCQAPVDKEALTARRDEYKHAALVAKKAGDINTAIGHIKIAKQFDTVIAALEAGQPVDLSAMPPSLSIQSPPKPPTMNSAVQQSAQPEPAMPSEPEEFVVAAPSTVLEALEQRLAKYKSQEDAAKGENNSSKARRMGRIVKQYTDAIRLHMAGKPFSADELPTPPGYPPIPVEGGVKPPPSPQPSPSPQPAPTPEPIPAPQQPTVSPDDTPSTSGASPDKLNVRKIGGSRQDKQLQQLLEKQKQFKIAALQAKQKGEVNQAKEYLRIAKGFDKLIEASNCGLPVDMNTVPVPPSSKVALETDFDIVSAEDCSPTDPSDGDCVLEKLEKDLVEQMKKSMETRNHFKAIGDIASANRFEQQALHSKKDLDVVRVARRHNHPIPRFHYETRSFSIVQCNTDLGDNDLELTIVQGINYNVPNPKEVDTYIRLEFPWPTEEPYRDKSSTIYNTNNPVYNDKFTLPIQRNVRACQRVFKRHAIKCEVWSKGGFFRGDSLIGTATIKLQSLENKCIIHESFDLMDGRKAVGGKLEVKVRLRNPILTKQVERVEEKWLVIDH